MWLVVFIVGAVIVGDYMNPYSDPTQKNAVIAKFSGSYCYEDYYAESDSSDQQNDPTWLDCHETIINYTDPQTGAKSTGIVSRMNRKNGVLEVIWEKSRDPERFVLPTQLALNNVRLTKYPTY
jgi:hypothetical protein